MDELEYREAMLAKAKEVTTDEDLLALIKEITEYKHDYGTIVRGMGAAMMGAFYRIERSPKGGITGFQGSCLMWEVIQNLNIYEKGAPLRIVNFNDLLYPQYADKYNSISESTWEHLQAKARKNLLEQSEYAAPRVVEHWKLVASGHVPFGFVVRET